VDFQTGEMNLFTKTGEWSEGNIPIEHESFSLEKGDALLDETQAFFSAIQNDTPVLVSGRDGLKALGLAEKIVKNVLQRLK
jgi:predicted dehydrogenase